MHLVAVRAALGILATSVALTSARLTSWSPCPEDLQSDSRLSCAYFDIPLDYHNASAGNGHLLVGKLSANAGEKQGTVFYNPGGPGFPGLLALWQDGDALLNRTGGAYDIVSWQLRGNGPFTFPGNVFCLSDDEFEPFWNGTIEETGINWLGNFTDRTDLSNLYDQAPTIQAKYKELGEKCLQGPNGTTLQYVGTAASVRDLVGLADAIQGPDSPIFFWGQSYGALMGTWFANMFPHRVGRVILDGVVDATRVATTQSHKLWGVQISSAEDVYHAFANACAMAGTAGCQLARFEGASGADVVDYITHAINVSHAGYLPDYANQLDLRGNVWSGLSQPRDWKEYANTVIPTVIKAVEGKTSNAEVSTLLKRRALDKRAIFDRYSYTIVAIACADSVDPDPSLSMTQIFDEVANVTQNISPTFGAIWPTQWNHCLFWPVRAPERYQGPFNGTFANKILIIGNTYDPATPFSEAQHMAEVMGDQAALVRQDGFGHTSTAETSECVTDIITAYLKDGTLPAGTASAPTVCAIDDSFEVFPGVKAVDVRANGTVLGSGSNSDGQGSPNPSSTPNGSMGTVHANRGACLFIFVLTLVSLTLDCMLS